MAAPSPDWVLLSLAPAPPERVHAWFAGIERLDIRFPSERTAHAGSRSVASAFGGRVTMIH